MKNEAFIASFNYSDFLEVTLPYNVNQFDSITVCTKPEDEETKAVCRKFGVKVVDTDLFTKRGAKFNRGAVYNWLFREHVIHNDWITLLDSDIIVPNTFKDVLNGMSLNVEGFYGARRYNIETPEEFKRVIGDPEELKKSMLFRGFGYGYFQMFNAKNEIFNNFKVVSLNNPYPESYDCSETDWRWRNSIGHGDVIYSPNFDINGHNEKNVADYGNGNIKELPLHVVHLGITGINSAERKTAKWKV
jgi:hypothetical protein